MSTPPLPKRIKIGHLDYIVARLTSEHADDANITGRCWRDVRRRIEIDERLEGPALAETLLHEILHAAWDGWELRDDDKEERTVAAFANALTTILRDNPRLLQTLLTLLR